MATGGRVIHHLGRYVPVRVEIVDLGAFSVHAGQAELVSWLTTASEPPDVVYLVHGEPNAAAARKAEIDGAQQTMAVVAHHRERIRVDAGNQNTQNTQSNRSNHE